MFSSKSIASWDDVTSIEGSDVTELSVSETDQASGGGWWVIPIAIVVAILTSNAAE